MKIFYHKILRKSRNNYPCGQTRLLTLTVRGRLKASAVVGVVVPDDEPSIKNKKNYNISYMYTDPGSTHRFLDFFRFSDEFGVRAASFFI